MFSILFIFLNGFLSQYPTLDEASVSFEITHMGMLKVEGRFDELVGEIKQIGENEWRIKGEVDVRSIDTGISSRDETILIEQYLNAELYPAIPFEANLESFESTMRLQIVLELRGIEVELGGELIEKEGELVSMPVSFKRSEIGLDFGLMDSLIGDEITLVIHSGVSLGDL